MKARTPGVLSVQVFDHEGHSSDEPLQIRLAILPDFPLKLLSNSQRMQLFLLWGSLLLLKLRLKMIMV